MNIDPVLWGPSLWRGMHYITLGYPDNPSREQKYEMLTFFTVIKNLLPCSTCRNNFAEHLDKRPLTNDIIDSKSKLVNWLIQIHNDVNISLGKPVMTYEQFVDEYINEKKVSESFYNNNSSFKISKNTLLIISIIIAILILFLILKCKNVYYRTNVLEFTR